MLTKLIAHYACSSGGFLGFPTWYHYLPVNSQTCSPQFTSLSDTWLIVAAIIEILLRIAGLLAVVYVIIGGINFVTSQGQPEKTAKSRDTIINALIGLAIAILSAAIVSFIARSIK
ncbi:MAG TPA: hypothetical protein VFN51_00835 [Candidatus Saccharimonadales bacterium]|nr:hypothetical protein [Candidatus Saccharimonadales bacterium]